MTESNRTAKAARVRDNQRRSRARRKEYIQDLEQRLRAFEKLGVEATLEVQAAGRKVAAENALLRSLLRIRGVTDFEVEHYLRAHRITPGSEISVAASPSLSQSPSDTIARQSTEACRSKSADICPRPGELHLVKEGNGRHLALQAQPASQDHPRHMSEPAGLARREGCCAEQQCVGELDTGQVTSCETAARIITMMRGHLDPQDARVELGCSTETSCMVKNMTIFDLLDR
ncbi:uncharacterized protein CIMG_12404 [Coccidioides immitis RS]|uniref:BZIP domain-containing protein n=3 Tax=Coccidioides immitis TaxID=5501 RepID=A0A0D8JVX5_COCIM|nr:uncharacterized protein CIMG_12404 [Coccidioides immitis RS]KJF60433.1 hypothetical protein CIMG_12404 [Coccidioides immitis RS]KMP02735.1 hypothetical protein CIRG_02427 [Coccidioides immitis RMSCC 2394]KMU89625.1 hypothetical protein CIHG_07431 [Coccidioides immitis H538.4]TPX23212.1 hypothetical protein DIZ76_012538 [Coccidioides immitis]